MVFVSPLPPGCGGVIEPKIVSYTPVVILPFFWNNGMKNWRYGGIRKIGQEKGRKRKGDREREKEKGRKIEKGRKEE